MTTDLLEKAKKSSFITIYILTLLTLCVGYIFFPFILFIIQFIIKILAPFFIAIIFYYLFRPLVRGLEKPLSIYGSIFVAYVILFAFFSFLAIYIYPVVYEQINILKTTQLDFFKFISEKNLNLKLVIPQELQKAFTQTYNLINTFIIDNMINFLSQLTGFFISLTISIFILFYFLKDDKKIYQESLKLVSEKYRDYASELLSSADQILAHFISGRMITSLIVSLFLLLIFLLIGIKYPFLLAFTSFIFFIIPTLGCFLAMILPLIVGFSTSTTMGIEILIIMSIASLLEGFLVTPKVMEQKLYIHPLTLIFIFLISGSIYGIFGLLFATPAYVLLKVFCIQTYAFFKDRQEAE